MRFPMSLRWSSYVAPKSPKGGLKNAKRPIYVKKIWLRFKKVCSYRPRPMCVMIWQWVNYCIGRKPVIRLAWPHITWVRWRQNSVKDYKVDIVAEFLQNMETEFHNDQLSNFLKTRTSNNCAHQKLVESWLQGRRRLDLFPERVPFQYSNESMWSFKRLMNTISISLRLTDYFVRYFNNSIILTTFPFAYTNAKGQSSSHNYYK